MRLLTLLVELVVLLRMGWA